MATLEAIKTASSTSTSVFEAGRLCVDVFTIETSDSSSPPKPLLIVTPTVKGEYPVFVFLHGTSLSNNFYTKLFKHIATHGFIAVAPQLYSLIPPSGCDELNSAALVADWLSKGLQSVLPQNVEANLRKVALSGHSRGGKTAFSLALGQARTSQNFSILIGLDPVAGPKKGDQVPPAVLTYVRRSMDLGIPVMVIGTGLGNKSSFWPFPCSCAPNGVNHKDFFYECQPPCCYFVAEDYGHMDMLDDNPPGIIGTVSGHLCKNGKGPRDPMRRCVGGLVVAFMRDYLEGEKGDLQSIIQEPGLAPVKLDPVQFIKS